MNYRAEDIKWAEEVWEKLQKKLSVVSERVKDILPGDADETENLSTGGTTFSGGQMDSGQDCFGRCIMRPERNPIRLMQK